MAQYRSLISTGFDKSKDRQQNVMYQITNSKSKDDYVHELRPYREGRRTTTGRFVDNLVLLHSFKLLNKLDKRVVERRCCT